MSTMIKHINVYFLAMCMYTYVLVRNVNSVTARQRKWHINHKAVAQEQKNEMIKIHYAAI